jgi:hypothetical protein
MLSQSSSPHSAIWCILFKSTVSCLFLNHLKPNDPYKGRTAPLISKRCILYIYSTNIGTEYFKHGIYSPFFSSKCSLFHNSNIFVSCIIHILYTGVLNLKKYNSRTKRLIIAFFQCQGWEWVELLLRAPMILHYAGTNSSIYFVIR